MALGFPLDDAAKVSAYFQPLVKADAMSVASRLGVMPVLSKPVIPLAPLDDTTMNAALVELATIQQTGAVAGNTFAYHIKDGWVHWSWEVVDGLDACFA
jgi:hypothetical protein